MMAPDLITALDTIGWTQQRLAVKLGCDERLVRRWVAGKATIPPRVGMWLHRMAIAHKLMAPPTDWRRRAPASTVPQSDTP